MHQNEVCACGFSGCEGGLNWLHLAWKNCPIGLKGKDHIKKTKVRHATGGGRVWLAFMYMSLVFRYGQFRKPPQRFQRISEYAKHHEWQFHVGCRPNCGRWDLACGRYFHFLRSVVVIDSNIWCVQCDKGNKYAFWGLLSILTDSFLPFFLRFLDIYIFTCSNQPDISFPFTGEGAVSICTVWCQFNFSVHDLLTVLASLLSRFKRRRR